MKIDVWKTIRQISRERGVDTSVIVNAIKESLVVASSQYFTHDEKIQILFHPEKGELRVYAIKQVVKSPGDKSSEISLEDALKVDASAEIGHFIELDLPSETLGRIAVQAAKQVIFQKVRDAEQEKIYNLFAPRIGEIITGVVKRSEPNNNIVIEVNKAEVLLPFREMLRDEEFKRGDRAKAIILQVLKEEKGHQVFVSRTSPLFLTKLLELEIPEITNGNIEIKDIVRHPGERAKVAVVTNEEDIDPVGACIGVKGNRILAISKELRGEKIDIIEWNPDPLAYAKAALSPAKPNEIAIASQQDKMMVASVPQDQLSLAIGKKGINVRLASRLVGWKIEIKTEND
jgi:N utilization substance protein A